MQLDRDDERVLAGEFGETRQRLMELLVGLGTVYGAERLVPIASAQVSGASYKTIGDWGLEWLSSLDARAVVPAVLNPVGMDLERWQEMGVDPAFAKKQEQVVEVYRRLGIRLECTCTPYYLSITNYGDHLAWSESSAVCYANSVIGARTNREGGPTALAAALVGKTPFYGLHLVENRRPTVVVEVEGAPATPDGGWYGALGVLAGREVGTGRPFFRGIRPTRDGLKSLGAAMAATGAVALFHVDRITPEARVFPFETGRPRDDHVRRGRGRGGLVGSPGRSGRDWLPPLLRGGAGPCRRAPRRKAGHETALRLRGPACDRRAPGGGRRDRAERSPGLCRHLHGRLARARAIRRRDDEQRQGLRVHAEHVRGRSAPRSP